MPGFDRSTEISIRFATQTTLGSTTKYQLTSSIVESLISCYPRKFRTFEFEAQAESIKTEFYFSANASLYHQLRLTVFEGESTWHMVKETGKIC